MKHHQLTSKYRIRENKYIRGKLKREVSKDYSKKKFFVYLPLLLRGRKFKPVLNRYKIIYNICL